MLVTTIKHGKEVIKRVCSNSDFSFDTETVPAPEYANDPDAALIIGRARVKLFQLCHRGESYSFPTNLYGPQFPTMNDWAELLQPYAESSEVVKVMHNANYDLNVMMLTTMLKHWPNIWDTMIGGWMADMTIDKGLKSRAPRYNRILRSLMLSKKALKEGFKAVDLDSLKESSTYGEQDVVLTDELYQMQRYGVIHRPKKIIYLAWSSAKGSWWPKSVENNLPPGELRVPGEHLEKFEKLWVTYHELPVLRAIIRAEQRGFLIDRKRLRGIRTALAEDKKSVLKRLYRAAGSKINLNSGPQIAAMLKRNDVPTPFRTAKGAVKLDANSLFKMQDTSSIVKDLMQYRKMEKMQSVYVGDPFKEGSIGLERFMDKEDRIHSTIGSVSAVTGRTSSSNPNLQNIPARQDTYKLRQCFIAPKGHLIICIDYAQLELRVMALLCKDKAMTKILCDPKGDIHQNTADKFGVDRSPTAKQLNFLMLYGGREYMLAEKLTCEGVPTTPEQARVYKDTYDEVYSGVHEYRESLLQEHREKGYVTLLTGRKRWLPNINWDNPSSVHKAETTLSNNVVQGSGQDLLKASIIRCDPACINVDAILPKKMEMHHHSHRLIILDYARRIEKLRAKFKRAKLKWILQVHDESIFYVDKFAAEEMLNLICEVMTWRHFFPATRKYTIPLVAEGGVGESWSHAKSKEPLYHCTKGF